LYYSLPIISSHSPTPNPNISTEFLHAASTTSSNGTPLTPATTFATFRISHGSFLPLTIHPSSHFSFFTFFHFSFSPSPSCPRLKTSIPACEGRISHHGPSVSNCNLPNGTSLATSKFSLVFNEHPLTPTCHPSSTNSLISSSVPVKECTSPRFGNSPRTGRKISRNEAKPFRLSRPIAVM
ncbi:MAG: hypothetical protein Q9183_005339, partial [Haloplaca sp. 2 TL-2023]